MAKCGFGQTTDDIRRTAKSIIDIRRPPTEDTQNANMPSMAWVYRLFQRNPQLALRSTMGLGKERATVTPQAISKWFEELRGYIVEADPSLIDDGSQIYNADESGFAFDVKGRKVAAFKGSKHVYHLTANTKTQVTVLACMNATGHYLPPMMVYPYKRLPQKDLANGFPEAVIQVSDNGWMTAAIFYTWLQDSFIPKTRHVKKPLLLLVDGHTSHTSLVETSTLCQENGIILYCFVAHASHLIQPLDQAFFGSIKPAWAQATRHHIANCGNAVSLDSFAGVLKPVRDKSATPEIAAQSFKAAGIVPFNPSRVLNSEKMAPCVVFRTAQAPSVPEEPAPPTVPSATFRPEESAPPDFHSAMFLAEEPPSPGFPSVTSMQDEPASSAVPSATFLPLPVEPASSAVPSATFLPLPVEPASSAVPSATFLPLPVEPAPSAVPSATFLPLPVEPASSAVPSATFLPLPVEPASSALPSATFLPLPVEPASSAVPSATFFPLPVEPASSAAPSATSLPQEPATPAIPSLNIRQLEAIKKFGIFLYDDLLRKQFIRFFSVLAGTETGPPDDSFKAFQEHVAQIADAFNQDSSATQEKTPVKTPMALTVDDILQIPKFNSSKKKGKKLTPTLPHCITSEDYRGAMKKKRESKEKEEKEKLVKKTMREENKRKKEEEKEMVKRQKELEKLERQQKKAEEEKRKQQKRELMKQRKELAKASRTRKESSSSGEDQEMERQMLREMTRSEDDEEWLMESDLCKGCHQKGDGELWLQCEICDGWWHKRCTKTAQSLSNEEIDQLQFWCQDSIPDK